MAHFLSLWVVPEIEELLSWPLGFWCACTSVIGVEFRGGKTVFAPFLVFIEWAEFKPSQSIGWCRCIFFAPSSHADVWYKPVITRTKDGFYVIATLSWHYFPFQKMQVGKVRNEYCDERWHSKIIVAEKEFFCSAFFEKDLNVLCKFSNKICRHECAKSENFLMMFTWGIRIETKLKMLAYSGSKSVPSVKKKND